MKNKLTALMLAVVVCIGIFPCTGFAARATDEDAIGLLDAIDVIASEELTENNIDTPISRIEFAMFMASLLDLTESGKTDADYYYDVPENHWGKSSLNALVEKGMLATTDHYFRPDDAITRSEAARLAVTAIGRNGEADIKGGYPNGYMLVASEKKLFSGTSSSNELTYRDAAVLLYNTAIENIVKLDFLNGKPAYYETDETLLSLYHDVYYGEGIVNAIEGVSVDENSARFNDEIIIGGKSYTTDKWHYDSLGMNVKFFYENIDGECKVIYIFKEPGKDCEVLKINSSLYENFDGTYAYYYQNEDSTRMSKVEIDQGAVVIKNGEKVSTDVYTALNNFYGTIRIIDTGRYEGADIVIIEDYQNIIVSYVNLESKLVYDKNNAQNVLNLDEEGNVFVKYFDAEGNESDISAITVGSVLSVAASSDSSFVIIHLNSKTVTGTIDGTGTDEEGKKYIIVDGDKYIVETNFYNANQNEFAIGASGSFLLDLFGVVVDFSMASSTDMQYALLINAFIANEVNGDMLDTDRILLKLYTASAELVTVACAEKLRIDNAIFRDCQTIIDYFSERGSVASQIIRFKFDSEGAIKVIDTVKKGVGESDRSLRKMNTNDSTYKHWTGVFGKDIYMETSTPLMIAPPKDSMKSADITKFAIKNQSALASDASYKVDFYTIEEDTFIPDIAICYRYLQTEISDKNAFYVVEAVGKKLNDDDDECTYLRLDNMGESEYFLSRNYSDPEVINKLTQNGNDFNWEHVDPNTLEAGDIVRIATDARGEVDNIRLIFDYGKAKQNTDVTFFNGAWNPRHNMAGVSMSGANYDTLTGCGYLSKKVGNMFGWGFNDPLSIDQIYSSSIQSGDLNVMVFDDEKKTDKCTAGSLGDLVSYEESSVDFSKIITFQADKVMKRMVIYK